LCHIVYNSQNVSLIDSTQNIAVWLVAVYTVHRNCNCLYCGLTHYWWSILCEGLKGVPSNFLYHVDKHFKKERSKCRFTHVGRCWIQQPPLPVHILHNCSSHWATQCYLQQWFESPLGLKMSHYKSHNNYTDHCENTPILPTYHHCPSVLCKQLWK
jgi:hypothetical protein